ncbi:MAG: hypothetical protein KDN20_19505 [Verrucomicrobiae bacterium]|nr:hypothetical protein [Verrucomicrobiae bacterium]
MSTVLPCSRRFSGNVTIFLAAVLVMLGLPAIPLKAGPKAPSPSRSMQRSMHGPQGFLTTNRYRPRIRFSAGKMSGNRLPIVANFSTQSGHVDRVEVRIDGDIVGTVRPEKPVNVGTLETMIDLSKIGPGNHKLVLWVWQGREGYQRLHGESKSFKFTR